MKYFIDGNKTTDIKKWMHELGGSCVGITVNSVMLPTNDRIREFIRSLQELESYFDSSKHILVQALDEESISIIRAADEIYKNIKFFAKIPMVFKNFELIKDCERRKTNLAATSVYDIIQVNQAIELGFEYSMVYYNKNPYKGLMEDAVKLKKNSKSKIKLVAASIKNQYDITAAIESGIEYATIKPEILDRAFHNRFTEEELEIEKYERS
jgi:transaldolase